MKKQHRFLIESLPISRSFILTEPTLVHHMYHVLKLTPGEQVRFFAENTDDILGTIGAITKKEVHLETTETIPKILIPKKVSVCMSITKRDTFELAVQKLTELGVHTIVPLITDRTIKQSLRHDRLQKISDEALEQSGHAQRVTITEALSLTKALTIYSTTPSYYCDTYLPGSPHSKPEGDYVLYIGPEGGWSDEEKKLFLEHAITPYSLGATILRAETAAIVGAAHFLWN